MHTANLNTLQNVLGHYGSINLAPGNTNLDPRLRPNGFCQKLNLTAAEVDALIAFLKNTNWNKCSCRFKMVNPI
jgi:cytochrome c peroxidase